MHRVKEKQFLLLGLAEILLVLFLLPGCFRGKERLDYVAGEQIVLTPGIYEIHAGAVLAEGQRITVELQSAEGYYRALQTNAVTLDSDRQNVVINAWVKTRITDARVQCEFSDVGENALTELALFRTGKGARTGLFRVLAWLVFLDGMLILRTKILDGSMTLKQQRVFWILAAGVAAAYFPYLTDYFSIADGTVFYLKKIVEFRGFSFENLFIGIPAGLKWLGFPVMTAYKMWVFLIVITTAAVSYGMFFLCVKEEYAAASGSMFYLLMPHYAAGIYQRGDIGEALLAAFLPLLVVGIYMFVTDSRKEKAKEYLCCAAAGGVTAGSSLLLLEKGTGKCSGLELGIGAVILLLGYVFWKVREKSRIARGCGFWLLCSAFACAMALFSVPGRWLLLAQLSVSVFAAMFCSEIQRHKSILGRFVFGLAAVLAVCSAVYHGNRIAYTSEAVYLYEAQNMANLYQMESSGKLPEDLSQEEGGAR